MPALVHAIHEGQALIELRSLAAVSPLQGRIIGRFTSGFYARIRDQIFAAAGPLIWPGPIHLITEQVPELAAEAGEVWLTATRLHYPGGTVDIASATPYTPAIPTAERLRAAAPLLAQWVDMAGPPEDLQACWDPVLAAVGDNDIAGAALILQGRGIGLTPSGDDVLAGLLLFARWSGVPQTELTSIAERVETTDLSRSFLQWAARGQSIEPIHALVICSSPAAERSERFNRAAEIVCQVGHRSGAALMAGLGIAAQALSAA